ncbi:MAG: DUF4081 domain-containing protein, partial [Actinomycetia bacterium]|nr:DUF4081 domain-containing protein [Actinomycetes bacterium]
MPGTVRTLTNDDLSAVVELLLQRPFENVYVASRIRSGGLEPFMLGCEVWGYEEDGQLVSILHNGANLAPVNATPAALDAFCEALGPARGCASMVGVTGEVVGLWERLVSRWGGSWAHTREIRGHQPLLVISGPPRVAPDPRVVRVGLEHADSYFAAAVAMYTEEVGVSPLDGSNGYRWYVERLLTQGRAMGILDQGQVLFKSDVGSATTDVCQVAGVWLRPDLRGHGLSARAMASVVELCRQEWTYVTL